MSLTSWDRYWGRGGQGIILKINIISCRMDMLLFRSVFHCGFCSLLIFRNLLLLIHMSFHFSLFISLFWFFLRFTNLFPLSPSFFLTLRIFLSFLSPLHCLIKTQYIFQSLLRLLYHAKISRSLWMIFLSGWDWRSI